MDKSELIKEEKYLNSTLQLVKSRENFLNSKFNNLGNFLSGSNEEYFEYLKYNANKMNEEDVVEIVNMQGRLDDLQNDSIEVGKELEICKKMKNSPYFASINIRDSELSSDEKYYIGIHSLQNENKDFVVVDWRSPLASIFYDYEKGKCEIKTNSSILSCELKNKRQYDIKDGKLNFYIDTTINIEDELLREALAKNTTNQMQSIIQTIQKEQNEVIRGDENKTLIVQGVAGSGKTAIALHRIAYLIYKMKGKIKSENINYLSPSNAFSSYISSVLPDLAENDIDKLQLDLIARSYLKKHLILERKFEQMDRLVSLNDLKDYEYKTSYQFLLDLLDFANKTYIDSFNMPDFTVKDTIVSGKKINELFFGRYNERDLFTRLRWITDNVFDYYFYQIKKPENVVKIKEYIFKKLYGSIDNKNCVKAYINFLSTKGMELKLIGDKVKNEDAYAILFFKMFIYGLDKYDNIKHLVIDEMQDYSPLQMYIINYLFDCPKTILGDYNQTLNPIFSKDNISNCSNIFGNEIVCIDLKKSYRSTIEIADFFNYIGNKTDAKVVSRNGDNVEFNVVNNNSLVPIVIKLVDKYRQIGYNSIGIITKTNANAKELFDKLNGKIDGINLIDDNVDFYDNKTCVISAYNSKGLEFDGVIIIDSDKLYSSEIDRNLLYIASTRALHKLSVVSIDKTNKFVDDFRRKND